MSRRAQIEAMLKEDPRDSFLRYALALELAGAGELTQAVAALEGLLADQPDYIPAYLQAGQFLLKAGDAGKARTVLEAGVAAALAGRDDHAAEEMAALLQAL